MDAAGLIRVDEQLDSFVGEVFSSLARKDRRAAAGLYVRGLMLEGRRKSMQPMAQRLRVDHQRLQQFVTSSPWDVEPVRKALSRRACALIDPDAWVIDDTGFVKDGLASPCVARQYSGTSGTLGKVGNCQVALSVHAASDAASAPLDWRLYVPGRWNERCAGDPAAVAAAAADRKRCDPRQRASPAEVADGPGDDRRVDPVGTHPAGADRGRRIRRHHRIPAGADRP